MSDLCVIIPNWNGQRFLKTCLDSLISQQGTPVEIIVVDNDSHDSSVQFITEHYPLVKLIRMPENVGFARGVNAGIEVALKGKAKLIALLNNDTEVDPGWANAIREAAASAPEAGFFASKILDFTDRTIIDSCGDAMSWTGRCYKTGELQKDESPYDKPRFVFGAMAAASVYRRDFFEKVGLFDGDFITYLEDVDIDFRGQLAGFRCLFVPTARIYHIGSATAGKDSPFSFKMMIRNHFHLIYKNFPTQRLCTAFPKLAYAELRLFAAAVRQHYAKEYFWGVREAMRSHATMRPKRKQIQAGRKVTLDYLDSLIEPSFHYKPALKALKHGK